MQVNYSELDILIALSLVFFVIGIYGVISKRERIRIVMGIQFIVIACTLVFLAFGFSSSMADPISQTYIILVLAIGATVIVLALIALKNLPETRKPLFFWPRG